MIGTSGARSASTSCPDETSGAVAGLVYCAVIAICFELFDIARAG